MEKFEIFGVPSLKQGSGIHIKKENRGKFTEYCNGEVSQQCIDKAKRSNNPTLVKRAVFAENARKWKHQKGSKIHQPFGHRSILDNGWISNKNLQMKARKHQFGGLVGNLRRAYNYFFGDPQEYKPTLREGDSYKNSIIIDKGNQHLYSYDNNGNLVFHTAVSTGAVPGNKKKEGDYKTPVGKFAISQHEIRKDSATFNNPNFWRLRGTGFKGIGIHGDAGHPDKLGSPASHACIRMHSDSIAPFIKKAKPKVGKTVYILDEYGSY